MMTRNLLIFSIVMSFVVYADDTEINPLASKIKSKIDKQLSKYNLSGYCDLFIEMAHKENFAVIKRVTSTGDHKLCKASKQIVRKGHRYEYSLTEKYIRLHIEN
ncbi:hypothetical protein [Vibrio hepatarius]|uniref:hypothetical protein n=1 Tax=Vibrio hepatarius TaxID=171383 RepID=UPI003735F7D6